MLERHSVTEANWRDAGKMDKNFLESETPLFLGRGVAALAADKKMLARTGQLLSSWQLGREYHVKDVDGRRPDWGALKIDFSGLPPFLVDLMRTGAEIQIEWLETVAKRTKRFLRQLPPIKPSSRKRPASK